MPTQTEIYLPKCYSYSYNLANGRAFLFLNATNFLKTHPLCVSKITNNLFPCSILQHFHFLTLVKSKAGKRARFNGIDADGRIKSYRGFTSQALIHFFN